MAEGTEDSYIEVVRHHNRVLRKVHKTLRNALKLQQDKADSNFIEICETKTEAELALEKLWTLGEFECGPLDYEYIVERCLEVVRLGKTNPLDQCGSNISPEGWYCTRPGGHDGPCAAIKV